MSELTRYSLAGPWKAEPDAEGEWVLFRDVRVLFDRAVELGTAHDVYHYALIAIAGMPLTFPASEAASKARDALDEARAIKEEL